MRRRHPPIRHAVLEMIRRTAIARGDDAQTACVIQLERLPQPGEQLNLIAARLQERPIIIMSGRNA
jgi:hypothetical protein